MRLAAGFVASTPAEDLHISEKRNRWSQRWLRRAE